MFWICLDNSIRTYVIKSCLANYEINLNSSQNVFDPFSSASTCTVEMKKNQGELLFLFKIKLVLYS